jgi:hypothetical protein
MNFLTYEDFRDRAEGRMRPSKVDRRWSYHAAVIEIIKNSETVNPEKVLEMGTMGFQLVVGSHTIDYDGEKNTIGFRPTYLHDARQIPWPIENRRYEWFVALRVLHHLWPAQEACFDEARRVAKNVILVVPSTVPRRKMDAVPRTDAGVTPLQIKKWNDGHVPRIWKKTEYGYLYCISENDKNFSPTLGIRTQYYIEHFIDTSRLLVVRSLPTTAKRVARRLVGRAS